ncbi:unknown [Clostridium sp. CAG:568]|nr:unknown [Clostridium sp. CAG:568]
MKKISSLLLTILCFPCILTGCDSSNGVKSNGVKDEKIDFFSTTEFTIDSFISAVKEYGIESNGHYGLSNAQSVACYSNDSIKKLLTSANYDVMDEKINVDTLWEVMYEDIFSKNVTYTLDSFFDTVSNKCVRSSTNVSCVYFIESAENYMANNDSIVSLCKNDGYGVYSKFRSGYELYKSDLIDLYKKTNTWINNNANIAYTIDTYSGYYPFAFEDSFWAGKDFEYEGNGYSFGDTSTYKKLVSTVKFYLKDPDSYRSNGNINFFSTSEDPVRNGYYTGSVYVRVPYRAKNSFGGYVTDVVWLTYNWNSQSFSLYGRDMPLSINSYPFETGYLN